MQWIVYGVLMILIVYFLPEGIVPAVRALVARPQRRGRQGAPDAGAQAAP